MKPFSFFLVVLLGLCAGKISAQNYPIFGPEKKVRISGLTFDAMEPFISPDGSTLFFNSLNAGGNTNLYYASRVDDTTFTYIGIVGGTQDTSANHLDAVASLDSAGNFFWVSLRGYPSPMENLHHGNYSAGAVSSAGRVYGDFYIYSFAYPFGWLIMDAAINRQGNQLYYCNALFDFTGTGCNGLPCEAKLGVAQKVNDSTFNKVVNTDGIFSFVNDTSYLVYAPHLSPDGLELYFTRLLKNTYDTEICVAVRSSVNDTFSIPAVIYSAFGLFPEAATLTTNKQLMYYHKKDSASLYRIFLRYRIGSTGINENAAEEKFSIYPNPATSQFFVQVPETNEDYSVLLFNSCGAKISEWKNQQVIDVSGIPPGFYFAEIQQKNQRRILKLIKQ